MRVSSMNPTTRFSNRVENYVKFRPGYPKSVVDLMRDEMNLDKSSIVADVGSGTGIFAKLLLENGNEVFGIEPNDAMREAGEVFLRGFSNFTSINAAAENTTLEAKSVDFITAAQSFHWFGNEQTKAEFNRILRKDGFVVLIWNERRIDDNAFSVDYETLLDEFGVDYHAVRKSWGSVTALDLLFDANYETAVFDNSQTVDYKALEGRLLSSSYAPTMENPRYNAMIDGLKQIFARHNRAETVTISYETRVFYGKLGNGY